MTSSKRQLRIKDMKFCNYEGIGHCVVGYADGEISQPAARKADYVYYVK